MRLDFCVLLFLVSFLYNLKSKLILDANYSLASLLDVDPVVFSLRIKFYPAEPLRLTGNGKVMIYQQIKRDLIHGRLYCSAGEAAALGALIVQGNERMKGLDAWRV